MRLPLQILFLTWVSSIEHYWVTLAERRGLFPKILCPLPWDQNIFVAAVLHEFAQNHQRKQLEFRQPSPTANSPLPVTCHEGKTRIRKQ